ncbi:MAG: polysaccharide deacetylase family protein [Hyphomicrobium sp.]
MASGNFRSVVAVAALAIAACAPAVHAGGSLPPTGGISDACHGRADVLGVSRIVEIDTAAAPRFGAQYRDAGFLEDGEVVLTFDDGPLRYYTQRVLDALEQQCVRATFFIVGRMAISDPAMLKDIARRGHTIGVHTWSHKKLSTIGAARQTEEIELGLSATAAALDGPVAPFFRYPYLRDSRASLDHLAGRQLGVFGIDVDSRDFSTRNPGAVQRTVLAQLATTRKGIILFHDIQPSTAGSIRSLLAELKARGFRIVHMVAKTPATTLPEYDAMAARELARKTVAAAKSPLATRAVTWPAGKDSPKSATPAATDADEMLPWLRGTKTDGLDNKPAGPAQAAPQLPTVRPPRRPEPPGLHEDPWQIRPQPGG